jgi:FkbM family methyltransferase
MILLRRGLGWMLRNVLHLQRPVGFLLRDLRKDALVDQAALINPATIPYIFDIGAHHGETALGYSAHFPSASIYSFEPSTDSYQVLAAAVAHNNIHPFRLALSDQVGKACLYVSQQNAANSLLQPITHSGQLIEPASAPQMVETTTLDQFCAQQNIQHIDILKMDVQGAELSVLRGAARMLESQKIDVIYTEISFVSFYHQQAQFVDVMAALAPYHFTLYDLYEPVYENTGQLAYVNAIFISEALRLRLPKSRSRRRGLYPGFLWDRSGFDQSW